MTSYRILQLPGNMWLFFGHFVKEEGQFLSGTVVIETLPTIIFVSLLVLAHDNSELKIPGGVHNVCFPEPINLAQNLRLLMHKKDLELNCTTL